MYIAVGDKIYALWGTTRELFLTVHKTRHVPNVEQQAKILADHLNSMLGW